MSDTATAAHELKEYLYERALELYDPAAVRVAYGVTLVDSDLDQRVTFLEVDTEQVVATMSTNRSRDETVDLTIIFSAAVAGEDDDREASRQAFALVRTLERYVRKSDPTLGGRAIACAMSRLSTFGYTSAKNLPVARLIEIETTFSARVRITG